MSAMGTKRQTKEMKCMKKKQDSREGQSSVELKLHKKVEGTNYVGAVCISHYTQSREQFIKR